MRRVRCSISNVEWRRAQVELERQIEHLELEKLRELDRMKSRFFADISHEFRTPLTLILGPVGQMLDEVKTPELAKPLRLIKRNARVPAAADLTVARSLESRSREDAPARQPRRSRARAARDA